MNNINAVANETAFESGSKRLPLVDVLRGFTLAGIFFIHMDFVFSGWLPASTPNSVEIDEILHYLVILLIKDKFRTLFCLLFGLSFYFQLRKFENNSLAFSRNFLKRTVLLLIFGLAHGYLFWYGDILRYYAVASLLLLLLFRLPNRLLLISGLFFSTVLPIAWSIVQARSETAVPTDPEWQIAWTTLSATPSYWEMLSANTVIANKLLLKGSETSITVLVILGNFLLGVWIGRTNLLHRIKIQNRRFLPFMFGTLVVGIGSGLLMLGLPKLQPRFPSWWFIKDLEIISTYVNIITLLLFYVAAIMKLFNHPRWQPHLLLLAPSGRTTLSNYLLQSVLGILLFYHVGFGLRGQLGPSVTLPLTAVLFALQVLGTNWWVGHFGMGPLEWLWRKAITERPTKTSLQPTSQELKKVA